MATAGPPKQPLALSERLNWGQFLELVVMPAIAPVVVYLTVYD